MTNKTIQFTDDQIKLIISGLGDAVIDCIASFVEEALVWQTGWHTDDQEAGRIALVACINDIEGRPRFLDDVLTGAAEVDVDDGEADIVRARARHLREIADKLDAIAGNAKST